MNSPCENASVVVHLLTVIVNLAAYSLEPKSCQMANKCSSSCCFQAYYVYG